MSNPKGDFVWYELLTHDAGAAQRFYGDVVGWTGGLALLCRGARCRRRGRRLDSVA